MLRTRLTAAATTTTTTTAVIAAVVTTLAAALPAASAAATEAKDDHRAEVRTVCAPHAYVKERPAAIPIDGLVEGEKVDVRRYSSSGRWAYGSARGPQHRHVKGGWVQVSDLCPKGHAVSSTTAKRYSVRIVVSGGGGPDPFQVGGLANVTVKDARHEGQALQLCITPAPTERPPCRSGHTGRTIDTIAWSQPGPTKVRVAIEGGPVIVKTVHVSAG